MNIVQITPGAGGMYCGNCFRDNALVGELRRQGHQALMVPLYLPMTLDEENQSTGTPIFFSGVNVYLEQKFPWLRRMPGWLHRWLASPRILKWAAGRAAKTRASEVGDLTVSMLRGDEGNQARELEELLAWLKMQIKPDLVCLSNAMLLGLARRLRQELNVPVACLLTGEDSFLDGLTMPYREQAWALLAERAQAVGVFISPSQYFAEVMQRRMKLEPGQIQVVPLGLNLDGYPPQPAARFAPPTIGFFARMCADKGLHLLVDAFIKLCQRGKVPAARLKIGGGCGPADEPFVAEQKGKLERAGCLDRVAFYPNVSRAEKLEFYKSLSVFSVPALYGQSFGLYLLEALACGVPVVQPAVAAFPEIIAATGGGLIVKPEAGALANGLEALLLDQARWRQCATAGYHAAHQDYTLTRMADNFLRAVERKAG